MVTIAHNRERREAVYTKIVIPFSGGDFSARSITVGRHLARLMSAPIEIVSFALTASHADDLRAAVHEEVSSITDVDVTWQVRKVDDVVLEIAKLLADDPGALICMCSVGRSHSAPVLGSVAEGVLKETFGPLLLVGPRARTDEFVADGAMAVCTDGSATANEILPIAAQWAITLPLEPWVINVQDPDTRNPAGELQSDLGTDAIGAWRVAHKLQREIGRTVQHDVLHDSSVARAIAEFADQQNATIIAMSTHGATGLRRVALGSVSMAVVHRARCPVLVHRAPHLRELD
jgi:nucleotide-binding universal stress UspA family protein